MSYFFLNRARIALLESSIAEAQEWEYKLIGVQDWLTDRDVVLSSHLEHELTVDDLPDESQVRFRGWIFYYYTYTYSPTYIFTYKHITRSADVVAVLDIFLITNMLSLSSKSSFNVANCARKRNTRISPYQPFFSIFEAYHYSKFV